MVKSFFSNTVGDQPWELRGANEARIRTLERGVFGGDLQAVGWTALGGAPSTTLPELKIKRLNGTLDGAGAATLAHGLTAVNGFVVFAQAWFKGNSGEQSPLTIGAIDGTNVFLTGGTASRSYFVTLFYTDNAVVTW